MVSYKGESGSSETKRHKLRENKTIMLPKPLKELPEPPEIEFPEEKTEKKKWLFSFFFRKAKPAETETAIEAETKAETEEEPEILKEIDLGKQDHSKKTEPELALWLNDGRTVSSLEELTKALKTMSNRAFKQHYDKGDIAAWVKDVIGNNELAARLEKAATRKEATKSLEESKKAAGKQPEKTETELPEPQAAKVEEAMPEAEIQAAIQKFSRQATKKKLSLEEHEKMLDEAEQRLNTEEDILNKKRVELAKRRYQLIRERGMLNKEKFEQLVKKHKTELGKFATPEDDVALPGLQLHGEYSKEKIGQLVEEARRYLASNDATSAEKVKQEIKEALEISTLTPEELKQFEYELLELETDIKLATLA